MPRTRSSSLIEVAAVRRLLKDGTAWRIRDTAGVSRAEVAATVGIDRGTLFKWETGRVSAPHTAALILYGEQLKKLAVLVDLDDVFDDEAQ